jgi:hypothetical protein
MDSRVVIEMCLWRKATFWLQYQGARAARHGKLGCFLASNAADGLLKILSGEM